MLHFKSILAVVTEDSLSDIALSRSIHLAQSSAAALTLVDVVETDVSGVDRASSSLSGPRGGDSQEDVIAHRKGRLATLAERARGAGVEVSEAVLQGTPFVEVIRMVLREGHDVVIKGATRADDGAGAITGLDVDLLGKCPCPVWILNTGGAETFSKILATVAAGAESAPASASLDRAVLELAIALAARDRASVGVLQPQDPRAPGAGRLDGAEALIASYPDIAVARAGSAAGLSVDVIARHAETIGADLIVTGAFGPEGQAGATIDAGRSWPRVSVLAMKPEDFRSPVTLDAGL